MGSHALCRGNIISPGRRILAMEANLVTRPENEQKHVISTTITLIAIVANRLTRSEKSG